MTEKKLQAVIATQDESGHWYVIPNYLEKEFDEDSENYEFCESGEFDNKYGEYRTGGCLNLVQLYAEI